MIRISPSRIFAISLKPVLILKLSESLKFDTCDFSGTEKHYVDNVHYTNEVYKEVAKLWAEKILSLQKIN